MLTERRRATHDSVATTFKCSHLLALLRSRPAIVSTNNIGACDGSMGNDKQEVPTHIATFEYQCRIHTGIDRAQNLRYVHSRMQADALTHARAQT